MGLPFTLMLPHFDPLTLLITIVPLFYECDGDFVITAGHIASKRTGRDVGAVRRYVGAILLLHPRISQRAARRCFPNPPPSARAPSRVTPASATRRVGFVFCSCRGRRRSCSRGWCGNRRRQTFRRLVTDHHLTCGAQPRETDAAHRQQQYCDRDDSLYHASHAPLAASTTLSTLH